MTSDETGRGEVYVRPFREGPAGPNDRIQVSAGGGDFPVWSRNGDELFFISNDMNLKQFDMRNLGPNRGNGATLFKVCPGTGLNARPGIGAVWESPIRCCVRWPVSLQLHGGAARPIYGVGELARGGP